MKPDTYRGTALISRLLLATVLAATLLSLGGCWDYTETRATKRDKHPDLPEVSVPNQSQVVTNLSQLSVAKTVTVPGGEATPAAAPSPSNTGEQTKPPANEELGHKIAAEAPKARYTQDTEPTYRGGTKLLNAKAKQYANFSTLIVEQTLKAAQLLAPEKLEGRRVPLDLQPVILTTVLDDKGRLNEIIIEQHSGDKLVDLWFIAACKKGVWSRNPPPGARLTDGTYRLRMEGVVVNASFDRYGIYSYESEVGISVL